MPTALVLGEALVDIVLSPTAEPARFPGGSPLNVAVGLARLGVPTRLHTAIGEDADGRLIRDHVAASGVTLTPESVRPGHTSVAEATIGPDGAATYDFRISWDLSPIDPAGADLVHTGSIGAVLAPGADVVEETLARATGLVSFDPNVRPALMGDRDAAVARVERFVRLADVVKASDEDLAWLYPGASIDSVLERWLASGPRLVAVTAGGAGARALTEAGVVTVPVPPTTVVDTIGAGDSFMAALVADVLDRGFSDPLGSLTFAARCAAITVSRAGANPPRRDELD